MFNEGGDIHAKLAAKYNLNKRVVSLICNYPFMKAKEKISDMYDEQNIMFPYFGKLKLKRKYKGIKYKVDGEYRRQALLAKNSRESI